MEKKQKKNKSGFFGFIWSDLGSFESVYEYLVLSGIGRQA
jgi:hypothetical protein